jgi:phosphoribosylformimino-5-aminoimidazole carboxamide ribotide isomerase
MFQTIFVLDIFDGIVVHAKNKNRDEYQPVHKFSTICNKSDPISVIDTVNPKKIYIADLNVLQGKGKNDINFKVIKDISKKSEIMLDTGISSYLDVENSISRADILVLGTETASLEIMLHAAKKYPNKISVSIDIINGKILTKDSNMPNDLFKIIECLNEVKLKNIIILDMDKVGMSSGIDMNFLNKVVKQSKADILLGGGVRDMTDIELLKQIGVKGALIATAIHKNLIQV